MAGVPATHALARALGLNEAFLEVLSAILSQQYSNGTAFGLPTLAATTGQPTGIVADAAMPKAGLYGLGTGGSWAPISTGKTGDLVDGNDVLGIVPYLVSGTPGVGTPYNQQRTPNVFKTINAVAINAETTIWTPGAGLRFRLMGFLFTSTGAAGNILLRDNTAGATIFIVPNSTIAMPNTPGNGMGNGILSAAQNNVLSAQGIAAQVLNGVVWGTEEP